MSFVIEILTLTVLLVIAALLYIISRELARGITILLKERESQDGQKTGQTINVNLSPGMTTGAPAPGTVTQSLTTASQGDSPIIEASRVITQSPEQPKAAPPPPKATPSGAFALKCPRCQAENSSYRHECFNCGQAL